MEAEAEAVKNIGSGSGSDKKLTASTSLERRESEGSESKRGDIDSENIECPPE